MLTVARIVGIAVGVFIGTIVDEQAFGKESPEWTAAIIPTLFAIFGWVLATFLVRRFVHRGARTS